jgi:hypothetical protein
VQLFPPYVPEGYILTYSDEFGELIRNISAESSVVSQAIAESNQRRSSKDSAASPTQSGAFDTSAIGPRALQPICGVDVLKTTKPPVWSEVGHWIVKSTGGISVHQDCSSSSPVELCCQDGDIFVLGPRPPRFRHDGYTWWLSLGVGTRLYSGGKHLVGDGNGFQRAAYIPAHSDAHVYLRNVSPSAEILVRELSGYGEPWTVEHEQVVVRRGMSTDASPWGIVLKDDIVGIQRRLDSWVQLSLNFDVRMRKSASEVAEEREPFWSPTVIEPSLVSCSEPEETTTEDAAAALSSKEQGQTHQAEGWMLVEHPSHGTLLRRSRKFNGGLERCVVTKERARIYRDVVNLCHRRIYEENLEELWEGDIDRMPTAKSLEAKLFDTNTRILHVAVNGTFAGGAIMKEFSVKAYALGGNSAAFNFSSHTNDGSIPGRAMVSYVDSCAAEPGLRAGSALWKRISRTPCVCIACHSILLQSTVDFWQSCGMRRLDPDNEADCRTFAQSILMITVGQVAMKLTDLAKALPKSKLPLFVWVNKELENDTSTERFFVPDDPEMQAPQR